MKSGPKKVPFATLVRRPSIYAEKKEINFAFCGF
jgi:hypothetical protein